MAEKVGKKTGQTTKAGRLVYETPEGEMVSEKSATIKLGNKYINVPSIYDGVRYSEDELLQMLKENKIEATSVHDSIEEAVKAAQERSDSLLAKGGSMESQMEMFEEGGLKDEGGTVDPVSGNEVPTGSTKKEVRDDIPAQLSEGEFVFPADVVRYIGLENLMQLRQKAKRGLQKMEDMGQMGNSEEATMEDDGEYDDEIDNMIDDLEMEEATRSFAVGGYNPPKQSSFSLPDFDPMKNLFPDVKTNTSSTPSYREFMGGPSVPQYETKQFIGPNNEMISITFVNGNPVQPIPPGYKEYKGGPIETPEVSPVDTMADMGDNEDRSDDREREEDQQQQYENYVSSMERLASFDPEFKDYWDNSIQGKANKTKGLEGLKGFNAIKAVTEAFETGTKATDAYERIAEQYGLNMDDYTNTGIKGFFDKFDENKLMEDVVGIENVSKNEGLSRDESRSVYKQRAKTIEALGATASQDPSEEGRTGGDGDSIEEQRSKTVEEVGSHAGEDPSEEGSMGTDQASADKEGGVERNTPFFEGGAVQQTAEMLGPKKRGRRPARKK